jgi:hypothetical protein
VRRVEGRYQVQFIATNGAEWVRFYVDEYGRIWAVFADEYEQLFHPDAEFMDITGMLDELKGFVIREVDAYEAK